ncbi:Spy/CpxP family protein refolding chaperone [Rhodanobacter sp. DHG33]|uniref:Spy/CpxP family protein refolding chaperone n=1 Tax=Rhodanobacter sp. DHG33 TaxID=2775921 RepID=UPI0017869731|nr:Spy/CpxP family protein refolding chaperone [Rhodanobacter sp. DHG33]MBD8899853.1 Spy/CpxP family protein refolding chaperone [Rhodanobacter sp. DHG33]
MRKNLILGLALSSALAIGSFAVAAQGAPGPGGPGGWGHHGGRHGMMDFHKLNLTDAQKASIKQIMKSNFEQNKSQRQALRQQHEAFEAMSPTDAGYQAAAASLAQAEGAATTARVQQMANIRAQIYNVLTPAQQSQLAAQKAQAQARRQQWEQFRAQQKAATGSTTTSGQ